MKLNIMTLIGAIAVVIVFRWGSLLMGIDEAVFMDTYLHASFSRIIESNNFRIPTLSETMIYDKYFEIPLTYVLLCIVRTIAFPTLGYIAVSNTLYIMITIMLFVSLVVFVEQMVKHESEYISRILSLLYIFVCLHYYVFAPSTVSLLLIILLLVVIMKGTQLCNRITSSILALSMPLYHHLSTYVLIILMVSIILGRIVYNQCIKTKTSKEREGSSFIGVALTVVVISLVVMLVKTIASAESFIQYILKDISEGLFSRASELHTIVTYVKHIPYNVALCITVKRILCFAFISCGALVTVLSLVKRTVDDKSVVFIVAYVLLSMSLMPTVIIAPERFVIYVGFVTLALISLCLSFNSSFSLINAKMRFTKSVVVMLVFTTVISALLHSIALWYDVHRIIPYQDEVKSINIISSKLLSVENGDINIDALIVNLYHYVMMKYYMNRSVVTNYAQVVYDKFEYEHKYIAWLKTVEICKQEMYGAAKALRVILIYGERSERRLIERYGFTTLSIRDVETKGTVILKTAHLEALIIECYVPSTFKIR